VYYPYVQAADPRWSSSGAAVTVPNTAQGADQLAKGLVPMLPTLTSSGACQGISMWWLIKRSLGEDFWDWFGPPKCAASQSLIDNGKAGEPVRLIKEIMANQAGLGRLPQMSRAANHSAAINYILSKTKGHLTNKRGLVLRDNATWKTLAYEIVVANGYCFIGFSRLGWGGHAIAAHICNDGSIEFFDPNHGEFEAPSVTTFVTWVDQILAPAYGFDKLTTFEMQTLSRPGQ
jgi:hypothetical protein